MVSQFGISASDSGSKESAASSKGVCPFCCELSDRNLENFTSKVVYAQTYFSLRYVA